MAEASVEDSGERDMGEDVLIAVMKIRKRTKSSAG
jgi:hypothetical protein